MEINIRSFVTKSVAVLFLNYQELLSALGVVIVTQVSKILKAFKKLFSFDAC